MKRVHRISLSLDRPTRGIVPSTARIIHAARVPFHPGVTIWAEWPLSAPTDVAGLRTFVVYGDDQSMSEDLVHLASCIDPQTADAWHVYEVKK